MSTRRDDSWDDLIFMMFMVGCSTLLFIVLAALTVVQKWLETFTP